MNLLAYVSGAARENVVSRAIAWLLMERETLSEDCRNSVLAAITGCQIVDTGKINTVRVEYKTIDIKIECQNKQFVIENKIGALPGDGQLEKLKKANKEAKLILLSFYDYIECGWETVSYRNLDRKLDDIRCEQSEFLMVKEFIKILGQVSESAVNAGGAFRYAFNDGSCNADEEDRAFHAAQKYKLQKAIQIAWLQEVFSQIILPQGFIGKPDSGLSRNVVYNVFKEIDGTGVNIGIQLERRNIKIFAAPSNYRNKPTDCQKESAKAQLKKLVQQRKIKKEPSMPKNRGFTSVNVGELAYNNECRESLLISWRDKIKGELNGLAKYLHE